jgi:CRP-like cAMP-binding protein
MTLIEIEQQLHELKFFADFSPHIVERLSGIAHVRDIEKGGVIFREGSECYDVYVIAHGVVSLETSIPGQGPKRTMTVREGDLLGWTPLLEEHCRMTARAVALEPTRLVALPGKTLRRLCEADHEVGYHVMRQFARAISQRLLATRVQLLDLFMSCVASRQTGESAEGEPPVGKPK